MDEIEQIIKTNISYYLAHAIGSLGYKESKHFRNKKEHDKFIHKFDKAISHNKKLLFVKHHIDNYDSEFPIWVAIELFTMGMLEVFYKNLNTPHQKEIAKTFGVSINIFKSWLSCIVYLRNLSAHYMRLYNINISIEALRYTG